MRQVVKRTIAEESWQPILDVVKDIPCDEDFENWDTNVRKDFLRKWFHTRSKKVQMVSFEACIEDEEHGIHQIEDAPNGFEERTVAEDFCRRFKARLSQRDVKILELRVEGFTYEEIAGKLDYKNHSGVIKRMQAIKKAFVQYEAETQ
jgi:ATP/maltotriose-dependent transcriptional regulator MalT